MRKEKLNEDIKTNTDTEANILAANSEEETPWSINTLMGMQSNYRYYSGKLAQLGASVGLLPSHMVVEVPSEIYTDGTFTWQTVWIDWAAGGTALFQFTHMNTQNGSFTLGTAKVIITELNETTYVQCETITTPSVAMPAPRRVWAEEFF